MPTPLWSPGEPYALGEIVQPRTTIAPVQTAIPNAGFETGTASWTGIAGSGRLLLPLSLKERKALDLAAQAQAR